MAYTVEKHMVHDGHYFVNGVLIAGAAGVEDAIRIFEESQAVTD